MFVSSLRSRRLEVVGEREYVLISVTREWRYCGMVNKFFLINNIELKLITIKICLYVLSTKMFENPDVSGLLSLHQWKVP